MLRRAVRWLANARAFTLAVLVHVLAIGILLVNLEWGRTPPKAINTAVAIKTTAIDTQQIKESQESKKQKEREKQQAIERQRQQVEAEKRRQEEVAKKRKEQELEQKRLAEKKKAEEKKAEQERQLSEKKKREQAEEKKRLDEKRKREQAEKERKLAEQKRQKELEARQREKAAQQQRQKELQAALEAEATASLIEHYESLINQYVQERWDVPPDPSIRIGMSCQVSVTLLPSGDILSLTIKASSGNQAFDDSAVKAVRRAEPLPLPPPKENLFNEFRHITIPFVLKTKKL